MGIRTLFLPGDTGACGYYRIIQQFQHYQLNPDPDIQPMYLGPLMLRECDQQVTVCQRVCSRTALESLIKFKGITGTKVIIDYDDLLWAEHPERLHKFNIMLNNYDCGQYYRDMKELLPEAADAIICTTGKLRDALEELVEQKVPVHVVPNMLSIRDWCFEKATEIINEDTYFYAGSVSHYNNKERMYGDFSIPLAKFLEKERTMFMGDWKPWFFGNCIAETGWVGLSAYPKALYQNTRYAKFTMAPVADNMFNACKSDLKYLESCAVGRVCLVSDFENSPYSGASPLQKISPEASIKDIRETVNACKEHYGEILDYQYGYLNSRWLDRNISLYTEIIKSVV